MSGTVRKSLEQIRREGGGRVDHDKLASFSEDDIERMAEADDSADPITGKTLGEARIVKPYRPAKTA